MVVAKRVVLTGGTYSSNRGDVIHVTSALVLRLGLTRNMEDDIDAGTTRPFLIQAR